jgi:Amt family ammonium transporter
LGAASGAIAGLVAVTPAAGLVGPGGALIIGIAGGVICVWGVNGLKHMLKADDSLDVFGIHGVGGIVGALLVAVFNAQAFGGPGLDETSKIMGQLWVQLEGILITIVWSAIVAFVAYKIADMLTGMRVSEEMEREGLDISSHGESAYHN